MLKFYVKVSRTLLFLLDWQAQVQVSYPVRWQVLLSGHVGLAGVFFLFSQKQIVGTP